MNREADKFGADSGRRKYAVLIVALCHHEGQTITVVAARADEGVRVS